MRSGVASGWVGRAAVSLAVAAAVGMAAAMRFEPAHSQAVPPGGAPADTFRVFDADLGPAWIDVSAYPPEEQQAYALFSRKCSKCHTLARPINSSMRGDEWTAYVNRMSRKPGSGISPKDGETILGFLVFDSQRRARIAGAIDPELLPYLKVSRELSGVRRFPASKQDIRVEDGVLRVDVEGDRRLDLSRFFASDEGQKLVRWTRRTPNRGELVLRQVTTLGGKDPGPAKPAGGGAALRRVVDEAVDMKADARERVEEILDWLDESVKREYRQGLGDVDAVLADRRGDATEFTRLFVAMSRACGVPARPCVGFFARRTGFFLHPWAEVWLGGWVPVDPYLGQLPADATHVLLIPSGADALSSWNVSRVPGIDRLQFRVVLPDTGPSKAGS